MGIVGYYGWTCAQLPYSYHFIDGVNILFHEAGHPIFGIFGNTFLMVLGGTLMQLIMPATVIGYFIFKQQYFSGAITGVWFAQNFFKIASYINDAVVMVLPRVGLGDRTHDWNYMLTELGMLNKEVHISLAVHKAGVVLMVISLGAAVYFSRSKFDKND